LELVAPKVLDPRSPWNAGPIPPDQAIRGLHGVSLSEEGYEHTASLLTGTMGFQLVAREGNRFRYASASKAAGSMVDLICVPDSHRGSMGAGTVHHVAFRTPDDGSQKLWLERLVKERHNVSPIMDRSYFHSIYFREPGGVLFEIATDLPGFAIDESPDAL